MISIKRSWCRLFHDSPMWPMNGRYLCRRCHCEHVAQYGLPSLTISQRERASARISNNERSGSAYSLLRRLVRVPDGAFRG